MQVTLNIDEDVVVKAAMTEILSRPDEVITSTSEDYEIEDALQDMQLRWAATVILQYFTTKTELNEILTSI